MFEDDKITDEEFNEVFEDSEEGTDAEAETEAKEPAEEPKGEEPEDKPEGESEDDAEPPSDEDDDDSKETKQETAPIAALMSERKRRQEAEEKLKKYEEVEQDADAPDPTEDPAAYENYVRGKVEKEALVNRINDSRDEMLEKHADYEDMELTFQVLAARQPALYTEMNKHPSPAQFAYEKAKEYHDGLIKNLTKDDEPDPKNEELSEAEQRKIAASKVPNLTTVPTKASNSTPVEKEEGFDEIFSDQTY